MKKTTLIILVFLVILCAGCVDQSITNPVQNTKTIVTTTTTKTTILTTRATFTPTTTKKPTTIEDTWDDGDFELGKYRPLYYQLSAPFADLIGGDGQYFEWLLSRDDKETQNECVAVSFVKKFNIKKEDFARANEELREIDESMGHSPEDGSIYELYDVDLIYTLDNEKINEFFLWENSIYAEEKYGSPQ